MLKRVTFREDVAFIFSRNPSKKVETHDDFSIAGLKPEAENRDV